MSIRLEFTRQSRRVWSLGSEDGAIELRGSAAATITVAGRVLTIKRRGIFKSGYVVLDGATELGTYEPIGLTQRSGRLVLDGVSFECASGRKRLHTWFEVAGASGQARFEAGRRDLSVEADDGLAGDATLLLVVAALARFDYTRRMDSSNSATGMAGPPPGI